MSTQTLSDERRFEKFVAVLIALTTVFTAVTTFLEHLASSEAGRLERVAQSYSIEATTDRVNGELRFSYDWQGAFQTWRELDLMITNAEQVGDTERADIYRAARDQMNVLSPLLEAPYFDSGALWTDPLRYESDLYLVESTRKWEQFRNASNSSNQWDQIANAFVLQLTLYAVALSLYGLSTTINSFMRWLFVMLGSLFVLVNIAWGGYILLVPIDEIPANAIDAYAIGVGQAYQGKNADAIRSFSQALEAYPDYANAYYERGFARLVDGDNVGATNDLEAALAAGREDTNVLWNLGWAYYMIGNYEKAIEVNQRALQIDSSLIGVRMNQGLAMLAQGRTSNAISEYDQALTEAARQVTEAQGRGEQVPSSLWYYLDAGTLDLQSLLDILHGTPRDWTQGPAQGDVRGDPVEIERVAADEIKRIKTHAVSLEYFGRPPGTPGPMQASAFQFVQEIYDDNGDFVDYSDASVNPYGINEIGVLFDFSGFTIGQHEVWKVYVNGVEDTSLRVVSNWQVGESGSAIKYISYAYSNVFIFSPGEYVMELYIDDQLVQSGSFIVENP